MFRSLKSPDKCQWTFHVVAAINFHLRFVSLLSGALFLAIAKATALRHESFSFCILFCRWRKFHASNCCFWLCFEKFAWGIWWSWRVYVECCRSPRRLEFLRIHRAGNFSASCHGTNNWIEFNPLSPLGHEVNEIVFGNWKLALTR